MNPRDRYTCEQAFQRLEDYLDKELSAEETHLVQAHLEVCAACASEYQFQESTLRAVRERVQRIAVPLTLRERIANALQQVASQEEPPRSH